MVVNKLCRDDTTMSLYAVHKTSHILCCKHCKVESSKRVDITNFFSVHHRTWTFVIMKILSHEIFVRARLCSGITNFYHDILFDMRMFTIAIKKECKPLRLSVSHCIFRHFLSPTKWTQRIPYLGITLKFLDVSNHAVFVYSRKTIFLFAQCFLVLRNVLIMKKDGRNI